MRRFLPLLLAATFFTAFPAAAQNAASCGLIHANALTKKIKVAIPMTIPGMMIATYVIASNTARTGLGVRWRASAASVPRVVAMTAVHAPTTKLFWSAPIANGSSTAT